MQPTLLALRAITGVYARLLYQTVFAVLGIGLLLAFVLTGYLATSVSSLWWLLLIVLLPVTLAVVGVAGMLHIGIKRLLPRKMTHQEAKKIRSFTQKLFGLMETSRMPYPLVTFMIAKDVVRGRESTLLHKAIDDSKSLRGDFAAIRDMFTS